jgi:diadenylate cyclase
MLRPGVDELAGRNVDELVKAATQLARHRYGALIVLERETGLQDYVERGVPIDGLLTRQLLINLFYPNSPLHDGAAVVRDGRIVAASVVLPLSDNTAATSQLGTRHRAALGISEQSDAIAVVISEETGQISIAEHGRLQRNLDAERLESQLRSLLNLEVPARDRGSILQGVGERLRLPLRGEVHANGSANGSSKSSTAADAEPSRTS